jgi:hypothetical protein
MKGREREGRDFANRLARPGWGSGHGAVDMGSGRWAVGGGHEQLELKNPNFGILDRKRQGQGRAGRAGQDSLQPAACNAQTAKSGRRRSSCNPSTEYGV